MGKKWIVDESRINPDTGTPGALVPAEEYVRPSRAGLMVVTDLWMDGTAATDGADIGSRRKRNEYMRAHDLIDANDLRGDWERAAKERAQIRSGEASTQARREAILRALSTTPTRRH